MKLQRLFIRFDRIVDLSQFCIAVADIVQCFGFQFRIGDLLKTLQRFFVSTRFIVTVAKVEEGILLPFGCQFTIVDDRLVVRFLRIGFLPLPDIEKVEYSRVQRECCRQ